MIGKKESELEADSEVKATAWVEAMQFLIKVRNRFISSQVVGCRF